MKKVGVILARFQPIHNGHVELIKKAVEENDTVIVFIGSANKVNERNPIPYKIREDLVYNTLISEFSQEMFNKITILPLDDLTDESDNSHDWGFYIYSHVVTLTECPNFTMYYSDGYEIITSWFPEFILRNNVSLALLSRGAIHSGLSATHIRWQISSCQSTYVKDRVPKEVYDKLDLVRSYIKAFENNGKSRN